MLDTNVLLSGLISPAGVPARLIDAWLDGRFTLISHALQLDELREVSRRDKIRKLIRPSEAGRLRSEEHTSELQSLMRISYAVFCLKKKTKTYNTETRTNI